MPLNPSDQTIQPHQKALGTPPKQPDPPRTKEQTRIFIHEDQRFAFVDRCGEVTCSD